MTFMKLYQFGIINGVVYVCTAVNEKVANIKTTIKVGKTNVDLYGTISTDLWETCVTEFLVKQKQQKQQEEQRYE